MTITDTSAFKAYDIRGIVGQNLSSELVYGAVQGYVDLFHPKTVVLGKDVRVSGPELFESAKNALVDAGVNVIDIGTISTDMMYFAVANYEYDGGLAITASHNPKEYNGIKVVREESKPVSSDNGLKDMEQFVLSGKILTSDTKGTITQKDILDDYCDKILSFLDHPLSRTYKIFANASCGMSGIALRKIIERGKLPLEVIELNFTPDGNFPNANPNPVDDESIKLMTEAMSKAGRVDFGITWDADADRCVFYDEKGQYMLGNYTSAVLTEYFLGKNPGDKALTVPSVFRAVEAVTKKYKSPLIFNKAGQSFIKQRMRSEDCIFGSEPSGHFYFRDFFYVDNGMIPLMVVLNLLEKQNKTLSQIYNEFTQNYFVSGEINNVVKNSQKVIHIIKDKYNGTGELVEIDGVSFEFPDWRFNLRSSNTEPLIRLNVESNDKALLDEKIKEVLEVIESNKELE